MLKKLLKNNILIIIVCVLLFYIAPTMYRPSQTSEKAIATAIGLDYKNQEFEVSVLVVVPTPEKTDAVNSVDLLTATGSTLGEAINNISLDIGKTIGLAHCDAVVISKDVLNIDLRSTLDYLNRSGELTKNAILFSTEGEAKEVLKCAISSKSVPALRLSSMVEYSKEFAMSKDASLDGFYTEYYTPSSVCYLPVINIKESESSGGGNTQDNSSQQNNKTLQCNGDMCVLKLGKLATTLKDNYTTSFNVLKDNVDKAFLYVKDVNDGELLDADVALEIRSKKIRKKATFEGDRPVITYHGSMLVRVVEINTDSNSLNTLSEVETKVTESVKNKLMQDVKESFNAVMQQAIDNDVDILKYDNLFSSKRAKEWEIFKKTHPNPQDFLQNIDVRFDIVVNGKF